jgi:hypothetical protein
MHKFKLLDTVTHLQTGGKYRILGVPSKTRMKSTLPNGDWLECYIYTGINANDTSGTFIREQMDMEAKFKVIS